MTTLTDSSGLSRRRFLQLAAAAGAVAAALPYVHPQRAAAGPSDPLADDVVAQTYYRVLLRHTRWAETQWDAASGHYRATDFSFAVVLGNAVLLTRGQYDAEVAGIDAATLKAHTIATIKHFAASNRLTGGTEWGKTLFFDTTFQLYFELAGRLLWSDLDAATQANLDTIAQRQATYTTSLGSGSDPASGSWNTNGLLGAWVGDTRLEEMGVYAQSLAPALAWAPDATGADDWRACFGRWSRNETGLPAADLANPSVVDGVAVSANTAHNLYDTFIVENHGSFEPHYQCELWRTSARNGVHFLTAGRPLPEVLTAQPNASQLWRSILAVMSDAGEPLMPMINDREHLYGRDVIPIAFLAQVLGDRRAAWAEKALADRLQAYQEYPPQYRIAKFSGEPKYEPEARAEVAISYLLHEWRAGTGDPVAPLSAAEVFTAAAGARDFGSGPGLVAHQSPNAWAGAVTKPGFVKFAWQPQHDDWLFQLSGATPMLLPATGLTVRSRTVHLYEQLRDGFDASAVVLGFDQGHAGFVTLPGGAIVYASSGLPGEGEIDVYNLTMPGVPGLDGSRTYTSAEASVTIPARDTLPTTSAARVDRLGFDAVTTRWVRLLGVTPDPQYGYSIFEFEIRSGTGPNLAVGKPTTASSADTGKGAALATDGSQTTRWAVSRGDRPRADSWLAVDLGRATSIDNVTLYWEAAAGRAYRVQVSDDGTHWSDVASYPHPQLSTAQGWLSVDGRAGLVVRGSAQPITVTDDRILLAGAPAAPLLVEGYPGLDADATRGQAARPQPSGTGVQVSSAEGHLTVFNLDDAAVRTTVSVPQPRTELSLYPGTQTVTATGTDLQVALDAFDAAVLPPRFTLTAIPGGEVPAGVQIEVVDGQRVRISGPKCELRLHAANGRHKTVPVRSTVREVSIDDAIAYPLADLAIGRITFPTNPLPPGMSDPATAVDGDPDTAWTPGPDGRMVVDLGATVPVGGVEVEWAGGRRGAVDIAISVDGVAYTDAGRIPAGKDTLAVAGTARYVALTATGWRPGWAALRRVTVLPG